MADGRLRIALAYDDSLDHVGGIPQYITTLASSLMSVGHDVTLLVGETSMAQVGDCPVRSLARNLTVRFNGNRLRMPVLADRAAIRAAARDEPFDVVHVQVPYSPIMAGRLIRLLPTSTAVVGTFHVAAEHVMPRIGARALAMATVATRKRFDEMICVSGYAEQFARSTFGIRCCEVVPNMVDVAAFRAQPLSLPDKPTIVSLGALVPRKGPLQLVEAFALVRADIPDARLVIGGDGPLRGRLARRISRLGLTGAVELVGLVPEADKAAFLREAHVACFPSSFGESFGVVLLEAMAAGGPAVLAGDNGGYAEVFGDLPEALCKPEPAALAMALGRLLREADQRQRLAAHQHRLVDRFDAGAVVPRILDVYARALRTRKTHMVAHGLAA